MNNESNRKANRLLVTGDKYVTEHSYAGRIAGDVYTFLRWDGPTFSVRDRDGDYNSRKAIVRNMRTQTIHIRDFMQHGSVLLKK